MTTSGTITFSRNRDQIINAAARKISVIEAGETPSDLTATNFSEGLNAMVKHWQGTGLYIWTMSEATLFLQSDQTRYTLGTGSTDHVAGTFTETALSAAALISATSITVDSITGIAASDQIGVQVDDGSIHWTTVNGAPSGSTITLTTGLDDSASDDALVLAYTSNIVRPLSIVSARRYNFISGLDTPIEIGGREDYFELPNKSSSGAPNVLFYDRRGGANATGYLYFWQPQSTPTDAIKFTWQRPIQDFAVAADDPDLPQEWIQTLIFNLALNMAPEYNVPMTQFALIKGFADKYLAEMQWNEKELGAISFTPSMRR